MRAPRLGCREMSAGLFLPATLRSPPYDPRPLESARESPTGGRSPQPLCAAAAHGIEKHAAHRISPMRNPPALPGSLPQFDNSGNRRENSPP